MVCLTRSQRRRRSSPPAVSLPRRRWLRVKRRLAEQVFYKAGQDPLIVSQEGPVPIWTASHFTLMVYTWSITSLPVGEWTVIVTLMVPVARGLIAYSLTVVPSNA